MHDTLALAHPEWVFPTWRGKMAWRAKEQAAALWADRIVTVSEVRPPRPSLPGFNCPRIASRSSPKDPTRSSGPESQIPHASSVVLRKYRNRARLALSALRRRFEPAQEPAATHRSLRPRCPCLRRVLDPRRRPRRRLPHPRPRPPRGHRPLRPGRPSPLHRLRPRPRPSPTLYRGAYALVQPS